MATILLKPNNIMTKFIKSVGNHRVIFVSCVSIFHLILSGNERVSPTNTIKLCNVCVGIVSIQ